MLAIAIRRPALLLILSLAPSGCDPPTEPVRNSPGTPVPEVTIEPASLTLAIGERVQLQAIVLASGGGRSTVQWISTDPLVAIVGPDGIVEAIATGEAYVIAVAGTARGLAEVGVGGGGRPGRPGRPPFK